MKLNKKDLLLYAVTDRTWLHGRTLAACVEDAIRGGATMIQLREKDMTDEQFLAEAKVIKEITSQLGVPLIINDNVDIAIAVDADGVHVGQSDMQAANVRTRVGNKKIIGVSAHTAREAIEAERAGADYLGIGAMFSTSTKADAENVSFDTLRQINDAVSIPTVAIGGISEKNILELSGSGIDGVAVVSCIFAQDNIRTAAQTMRALAEQL